MFPFRRKREKKRDVIPAWAKLAVLVLILYAVTNPNHKSANAPKSDALGTAKQTFADYKKKLMPMGVLLHVEEASLGKGPPVLCGQDVRIAYDALAEDGKSIDTVGKEKPYTFRLGAGEAMPAFEQGVMGMNIGGRRSIFARNTLAYGGHAHEEIPQDATVRFNVEVLGASPDLSGLEAAPYRIADTAFGEGNAVTCGQPVKIMATIWAIDGKKLFATKEPITFTPGKSEMAMGIEQGVIGMHGGGARTLIVPPAFQKPMQGGKPALTFSLPQPQTVIVDIIAQ